MIKNLSQLDLTRMVDEANKTCLKGNVTWVLNRTDFCDDATVVN